MRGNCPQMELKILKAEILTYKVTWVALLVVVDKTITFYILSKLELQ